LKNILCTHIFVNLIFGDTSKQILSIPIGQLIEKTEETLHLEHLPHSKLYATLDIGGARVARTRQVEFHPQNPVWNESFRVYVAHSSPTFTLSVKNQLPVGAKVVARATISTTRLLSGEPIKERFQLYSEHGCKLHKYVW
jgi:phospholipase D1/2